MHTQCDFGTYLREIMHFCSIGFFSECVSKIFLTWNGHYNPTVRLYVLVSVWGTLMKIKKVY